MMTTFYIPLDVLATPASGDCIAGSWWSIHPERGAAFYAQLTGYERSETPSPQCNQSEATSRALTAQLYPDHEVRQIPVAFTRHAEREFARLRAAALSKVGAERVHAQADPTPVLNKTTSSPPDQGER